MATPTATKKGRGRPKKEKPEETPKKLKVHKKPEPEIKKTADKEPEEKINSTTESVVYSEETEQNEPVETPMGSVEEKEKNEEMSKSVSEFEIEDADIVHEEYSPIDPDVIHRGYESGNNPITVSESEEGIHIPEAKLTFGDNEAEANREKAAKSESSTQQGQQGTNTGQKGSSNQQVATKPPVEQKGYWEHTHSQSTEQTTESPAEKRRNATKMADTLLLVYRDKVPELFKYLAKFNEGKISKMELNGEIDRNMPVLEDGTTIGVYIARVNNHVEANFVISDEQIKEVREPLIDWLMEKDLKLTPQQRLLIAIGSQMVTE